MTSYFRFIFYASFLRFCLALLFPFLQMLFFDSLNVASSSVCTTDANPSAISDVSEAHKCELVFAFPFFLENALASLRSETGALIYSFLSLLRLLFLLFNAFFSKSFSATQGIGTVRAITFFFTDRYCHSCFFCFFKSNFVLYRNKTCQDEKRTRCQNQNIIRRCTIRGKS